jgi:adenosylmethionine-8-amino-7-oxononanoate aminotransferase
MPAFVHVPAHFRHHGPDAGLLAAKDLEDAIVKEGPDTIALFLIEPVLGGGAYVPPRDYFQKVREICDKYDILLAADEVITGFGRTGRMFALDHWGVEPDLVQFAKGVTGGYFPLGGVGISDEIAAVITSQQSSPWMHCYTYGGHPVGCAIALATIDVLEREQLPQRATVLGERLVARLSSGLLNNIHVGEVRGLGLMVGIDLVKDKRSRELFDPELGVGAKALNNCRALGLVTRGRGDTIYLGPPLTTTENEVDTVADIVISALELI